MLRGKTLRCLIVVFLWGLAAVRVARQGLQPADADADGQTCRDFWGTASDELKKYGSDV